MDEESKKAIADAVAEATKGLKDKNAELISEVRTLKKDKQEALDAAETAAEEAATKSGDIEAVKSGLQKKHDAELKKRDDALTKLHVELSTLKIDNVISEAIAKAGVLPIHAEMVSTYLKAGASMKDGEAMKGDTALPDYLTNYFASDAAKHYVAAPQNSGAGAVGSSAKPITANKKPETAEEWERFYKESEGKEAEANELLKSWGM